MMKNEDWDKVEHSMQIPWGWVTLVCDGYQIDIRTGIYKRHLSSICYVNGSFKGAWILNDCEERRRFFRPVKRLNWKPRVLKGLSKKKLKCMNIDPAETSISYSAEWTSFRSLKAHLIKNNTSIELAPEA
jgi:hypothetical protein